MARFSESQLRRYSRHILLPTVGGHGQARLLTAEVALAVDGAAGQVAAVLLAAAGVGHLVLVGALARPLAPGALRFPFAATDRGRPLGEALAAHLVARNPDVRVDLDPAGAGLRVDGDATDLPLAEAFARAGAFAAAVVHRLATATSS